MKKTVALIMANCIILSAAACSNALPTNHGAQSPGDLTSSMPVSQTPIMVPTETAEPTNTISEARTQKETPTPNETQIPTPVPDGDLSTPVTGAVDPGQTKQPANATATKTGLPDGTIIDLVISDQANYQALIMHDDFLVADYAYAFGQLKDADGVNPAGFLEISISSASEDGYKNNAIIYNAYYNITIVEGETSFICNDTVIPLTVPAQMIDGCFYVPLLAPAEAIHATVEWDADTQTLRFFYQ